MWITGSSANGMKVLAGAARFLRRTIIMVDATKWRKRGSPMYGGDARCRQFVQRAFLQLTISEQRR